MVTLYSYLQPYKWNNYIGKNITIGENNIFYDLTKAEIDTAEQKLQMQFPNQLRQFYQEIGYGHLTNSKDDKEHHYISNEILPPLIAVDYMQGIIEHPGEEYYMSASTYEDLQPGDLPFFEIGDSSSFMVMKLNSDNPNAVYSDCGVKIEDSFERFIYRLYHEDPAYYGDIIDAHYAALKDNV